MNPDRRRRVDDLFQQALDLPTRQRQDFLAAACGDDPSLQAEVASLLDADQKAARCRFMDLPEEGDEASEADRGEGNPWIGHRIGPYEISRELGRGGMSIVYLADRADGQYDAQVAIKLMRRDRDSEALMRRFHRERQMLAHLDHANIARLFDAGVTDEGISYFVMEHVAGMDIVAYCDRHRLSLAARLALFQQVCGAVHHAHQNLIVHRDLKPANVLVTPEGIPKLLDFGIAQWLGSQGPSQTTGVWGRPLTPTYASPEQIRGEPIATTSDVYSLGVMLYRLLTGRHPLHQATSTFEAIENVLSSQEPMLPSLAVAGAGEVETGGQEEASGWRAIGDLEPHTLRRLLAADLDNIVLMAMRKEPARRYGSVMQLSEDLRRYQMGLPVVARKDTWRYRARKFVRRNRLGVAAAALISVLIFGFVLALARLATDLAGERDRVAQEQNKTEEVVDALVRLFEVADPRNTDAARLTVVDFLDQGAKRIGQELAGQPAVQARFFQELGVIHHQLGLHDRAAELLAEALRLRRQDSENPTSEVAESLVSMAVLMSEGRDLAGAEELALEALAFLDRSSRVDTLEVAETLNLLSVIKRRQGKAREAEEMARRAIVILRQTPGGNRPDLAEALGNLGGALLTQHELGEAERSFREALDLGLQHLRNEDSSILAIRKGLAQTLEKAGHLGAAESIYRELLENERRVYGEKHPRIAFTLNGLGHLLLAKGDLQAAESYIREGLELRQQLFGQKHLAVAVSLRNLANVSIHRGDFAAAEPLCREMLAILRATQPEGFVNIAHALLCLGRAHLGQKAFSQAEILLREALDLRLRSLPHDGFLVAEAEGLLGRCLTGLKQYDEAQERLLRSHRLLAPKNLEHQELQIEMLHGLVELYRQWERPAKAEQARHLLTSAESGRKFAARELRTENK